MSSSVKIERLSLYPIKSCMGLELEQMRLGPNGGEIQVGDQVIGDREWLFIDQDKKFLTQRTLPELSLIKPKISKGMLTLEFGNQSIELHAGYDSEKRESVEVWSTSISSAVVEHPQIKLLQDFLGSAVSLVRFDTKARRMAKSNGESLGVQTRFTDAEPYLVVNQASLADLNLKLSKPVPMSRFRANLEFSGAEAFAEDHWELVKNKKIQFKGTKGCSRCVMVNIDQENQGRVVGVDSEVLKTLGKYRLKAKGIKFGQYMWTDNFGEMLKIGDQFTS